MRISITFLLLCLVCCAVSQPQPPQSINFQILNLQDGQVELANPPTWQAPDTATGFVTVEITSDYPADVCFQEGIFGAAGTDLSISCNPEGFIAGPNVTSGSGSGSESASASASGSASGDEFDGANTGGAKRLLRRFYYAANDDREPTTQDLWLRTGPYTISAAWSNQPETPDNATSQTGMVNIQITWTPCAPNGPIGPQCQYTPIKAKNDTPVIQTATPTAPVLISFENGDNALLTLLTFVIVPTTTTMVANATTVQAYVRRDAVPFLGVGNGLNLFDGNQNGSSNGTDLISFANPEGGKWYLFIMVTEDLSLNITVQTNQGCNTNEGLFPDGSGDCIPATTIYNSGQNSSGFTANGTTFSFNSAPIAYFLWNTSNLLVGVVNADHSDEDAPLLFASTVGIPSSNQSEFSSVQTNSQVNFINVQAADPSQIVPWIIAVESPSQGFEIWAGAGCANNCSDIGTCDAPSGSNGICSCPEHYKDFQCSTKSLKTIYIVLIAIGGAIVLAIAIGVPVGCYIKNRKRARYERV